MGILLTELLLLCVKMKPESVKESQVFELSSLKDPDISLVCVK